MSTLLDGGFASPNEVEQKEAAGRSSKQAQLARAPGAAGEQPRSRCPTACCARPSTARWPTARPTPAPSCGPGVDGAHAHRPQHGAGDRRRAGGRLRDGRARARRCGVELLATGPSAPGGDLRGAPRPPTPPPAPFTSRSTSPTRRPRAAGGHHRRGSSIDVGEPSTRRCELPLSAATVRGTQATVFVVQRRRGAPRRGCRCWASARAASSSTPGLKPGALVVTQGRGTLHEGDAWPRAATPRPPPPRARRRRAGGAVTKLALRNPIAILMACVWA